MGIVGANGLTEILQHALGAMCPLIIGPFFAGIDQAAAYEKVADGNVEHSIDRKIARKRNPKLGWYSKAQRSVGGIDVSILDPGYPLIRLPDQRKGVRVVGRQCDVQTVARYFSSFMHERVGPPNLDTIANDQGMHSRIALTQERFERSQRVGLPLMPACHRYRTMVLLRCSQSRPQTS